MLTRWGYFVYRRRRLVLALSGLSLLLAIALMIAGAGTLSSSGFVDRQSESQRVAQRLSDEFGRGQEQIVFIFDGEGAVTEDASRAAIEAALAPVAADPRVAQVLTTWNTGNPAFVSTDGRSAYAVAQLDVTGDDAKAALDDFAPVVERAVEPAGYTVSYAGWPAVGKDLAHEVEAGIMRAETVSVPLTIVIQLAVFGSLVAAGLPLLVAGLAIAGSIAVILALANVSDQSVFAINIITLLGLALGVDYSLFMVARFREELRRRPVAVAVAATMGTTGKAILFSGLTVIFGLAGTFFFPIPALRSMGLAGMLAVALALAYGLTFLPAMLSVLGHRVNAVPIRLPGRARNESGESRFWHGIASGVMRRPVAVLVPVLALLLVSGTPFLRLDLTPGGPELLPEHAPARIATDRLATDFPAGEADPIPVLFEVTSGEILSAQGLDALEAFVAQAETIPHVTRIESILTDPAAGDIDWQAVASGGAIPEAAQPLVDRLVRGGVTLVQVVADVEGQDLEQVVRDLRAIQPWGANIEVGGTAATSVDTVDGIKAGLPGAVVFVIAGSYLILLFTFGSVFLPLKAIVMTLLSISASLGTLVLVFQDGHLSSLLGFTATGEIVTVTPILMFSILFGLSMDYEVLMLTRIQEEYLRTGDNRGSVAFGLERTARVITSAAAIMMVAFGAFMLADIVIIKSLGFGLTLAVLIDATIVRGLLVPATMRLLGDWNWWAPAPLKSIVGRIGLSHAETPVPAPVSGD